MIGRVSVNEGNSHIHRTDVFMFLKQDLDLGMTPINF